MSNGTGLEAYLARRQRTNAYLKDVSEQLVKSGCHVLVPKDYFTEYKTNGTFIVIVSEDWSHCFSLEFGEVPYRWSIYAMRIPDKVWGSSIRVEERDYTYFYTVEDLLKLLETVKSPYSNPELLKKRYAWLKEYELA